MDFLIFPVFIIDMDNQITILQSGIDEKNTLITRLRAESVAVERNMTLKTASLATGESMVLSFQKEVKDLKSELIQRDILLKQSVEKQSCADVRVESLQVELEKLLVSSESERTAYTLREANSKKLFEDSMADLISKNNERIDTIKKENSKKSSLARTLLTEREEENNFLRTKNEELVIEIKSGAPSERRIFELAEVQAKREAVHGLHGLVKMERVGKIN